MIGKFIDYLYEKYPDNYKIINYINPWYYSGYIQYLFSDLTWCDSLQHQIQVIFCRIKGHPNGVIWYSSGYEPDMSCKDCGDQL